MAVLTTTSAGPQIRGERIDHVIHHRTGARTLTGRDVVDEDREREQVTGLDADIAGERRHAVERAGLRAHAALRRLALPAPRERAVGATDGQGRDEVRPDPVVLMGG